MRMMYKVHKWLAVTVGAFITVWFISGVVMILPPLSPGSASQGAPAPVDFQEITVSPAKAVASLAKALGAPPQVTSVSLGRILDVVVYRVTTQSSGSYLINARSGQVFTITPELAEQIDKHKQTTRQRVFR